jgi:site-specific DNA-methyltransferase (adenine-specific)
VSLYYQDDHVTLYHGDCLTEHREWLSADALVTDPPYGRNWFSPGGRTNATGGGRSTAKSIAGDKSTDARDGALQIWGDRQAVVFGDIMLAPPVGAKQVLIYAKAEDAGVMGATAGFRRDAEAIYLLGKWPSGIGGRTSILKVGGHVAGPTGPAALYGHPHSKPIGLMENLISISEGVIADPFAGSGATLVAAKNLGRKVVGVEVDEKYCEIIAKRCSQEVLDLGAIA